MKQKIEAFNKEVADKAFQGKRKKMVDENIDARVVKVARQLR